MSRENVFKDFLGGIGMEWRDAVKKLVCDDAKSPLNPEKVGKIRKEKAVHEPNRLLRHLRANRVWFLEQDNQACQQISARQQWSRRRRGENEIADRSSVPWRKIA